jgi:hypothetical protein
MTATLKDLPFLLDLARKGKDRKLARFIQDPRVGPDFSHPLESKRKTFLGRAILYGQWSTVDLLLASGADPDLTCLYKRRPCAPLAMAFLAAGKKSKEEEDELVWWKVMEKLLLAGANPCLSSPVAFPHWGETLLHAAIRVSPAVPSARHEHLRQRVMGLMLDQGESLARTDAGGKNALHHACRPGCLETFRFFVSRLDQETLPLLFLTWGANGRSPFEEYGSIPESMSFMQQKISELEKEALMTLPQGVPAVRVPRI